MEKRNFTFFIDNNEWNFVNDLDNKIWIIIYVGVIFSVNRLITGGLLMTKVIAVTFCVTLAASLAARLGSIPMAAFQPCLQVWLASSLFADGLAIAVQVLIRVQYLRYFIWEIWNYLCRIYLMVCRFTGNPSWFFRGERL